MMATSARKTNTTKPQSKATAKPKSPTESQVVQLQGDSAWAHKVVTDPGFPKVARDDPYLAPYAGVFKSRFLKFKHWLDLAATNHGSLAQFASAYDHFGFSIDHSTGEIVYCEYAPGAAKAHLIGDFNGWDRSTHPLARDAFGTWTLRLPAGAIAHGSMVKIQFTDARGSTFDRISPWARRVVQDQTKSVAYESVYWNPTEKFVFKHPRPAKPAALKIYEAHVGIASEEPRIATYKEFTANVLPRIKDLGYNTIQLMAVQEHAYYASFGYQVTSFYAPSSRFGTPEDLMELIDEAHGYGLTVLLDLVHSHASKNSLDGLNMFDGTDHCYFHAGPKGWHSLWDSRLFDYGSYEAVRFLLSNVAYWLREFQFDGFRFDGVTSMLYTHHGIATGFSGDYGEYFGSGLIDDDAIVYMMLANHLVHNVELPEQGITIAEDVSGMPGLCRPIAEGGAGFDYRLGMAVPDTWIKLLKEFRDEDWDMGHIAHTLVNRRGNEATIGYAESHDQALVGDKTLAFWLMDKDMYFHMSEEHTKHPPATIERGMALHKMIRLVTMALSGEGYLTFMGNEFGHPEWLDFPRAGNNDSYHYARRQWSLATNPTLRYRYLDAFDTAMLKEVEAPFSLLGPQAGARTYVTIKHEGDKVLAFERWDPEHRYHVIFAFNWHPTQSYTDYKVGTDVAGDYSVVLSTDEARFGGQGRIDRSVKSFAKQGEGWNNRQSSVMLYLPARTAVVLVCRTRF
ncbi:1,4-alpha-glucan branching enzyme [Blastocladiella britannica]|nr:1,4-alpha-glucan branching enzyme [Blastocladiella britannica]